MEDTINPALLVGNFKATYEEITQKSLLRQVKSVKSVLTTRTLIAIEVGIEELGYHGSQSLKWEQS
jgi:hypothetical protein